VPVLVTRRAPKSPRLTVQSVRRVAEAMLEALALPEAELSVLLTDDRTIHALNRQHRDKDRPTDVLSFPLDEDAEAPDSRQEGEPRVLGDVVISLDTAERQARGRKRPLAEEVRFLLAHGLLHLIGYDHDTAPRKRRMGAMTRKLVRAAPLETIPAKSKGTRQGTRGPALRRRKGVETTGRSRAG
jgi:probable rRNA maturation factor